MKSNLELAPVEKHNCDGCFYNLKRDCPKNEKGGLMCVKTPTHGVDNKGLYIWRIKRREK